MSASTPSSGADFILYQTQDGRTRVQCRFDHETIWLTQALLAELFQKDVRTINEHLINIFDEGEISRGATVRKFRIVQQEGARQVAREVYGYFKRVANELKVRPAAERVKNAGGEA